MLITSKEGELNMKIKVMLLGALIIMSLLLASCVTYDAPAEEVELVDDELADVDADVGEEETVEGTAEEVEDTEEAEEIESTEHNVIHEQPSLDQILLNYQNRRLNRRYNT